MKKNQKRKCAVALALVMLLSSPLGVTGQYTPWQGAADVKASVRTGWNEDGLTQNPSAGTGATETSQSETSLDSIETTQSTESRSDIPVTTDVVQESGTDVTGEDTTGEIPTEQPSEPATEEPTTAPDYEIIDDVYKVRDGILIEYLGDKEDADITEIQIPAVVQEIGAYVFENCVYIETVQFPQESSLTLINPCAFQNCTGLKHIELPQSVVRIEEYAFYGCTRLETMTLPENLKNIAQYAFYGCSSLEMLTFAENVKNIEEYAFYGCSSLKEITLPESLTTIGQYTFGECSALENVLLAEGLKTIGYKAFYKGIALTELTIPSTVTEGEQILGTTCTVKKVTFAPGIKTIPDKILKNSTCLETLSLPDGLSVIGSSAFAGCTGLKKVTIPNTVITIKASAFDGCTSLTTAKMSTLIQTLGNYAFRNCTTLTQIEMRKTLTNIGKDVFAGADNVTLLVFANSTGKAYARKNNLKWEYTASEVKRRAANETIYQTFMEQVGTGRVNRPQLKELTDYVPQGVCCVGNYLVVSMYYKNLTKNSILLLYKKKTGKFVKKILLPSKDHVGSATNIEGRLVLGLNNISTTDYAAVISLKKLKKTKNGATISYDYIKKIQGRADFATYDGNIYWAGHSANISTARMYGYKVKIKKKKLVFTKKYSYVVPANTQGVVVKRGSGSKRTFVFSQSYGRLNNSALITYTAKIKKVTTLGTAKSTKVIPCMSEGMFMTGSDIYLVFESAAGLYCGNPDNTSEIQIPHVCKFSYSSIVNFTTK